MRKPRDYRWACVYGEGVDTVIVPAQSRAQAMRFGSQLARDRSIPVDVVTLEPHMQNADGEWLPQAPDRTVAVWHDGGWDAVPAHRGPRT